jgi:hypothetical protein
MEQKRVDLIRTIQKLATYSARATAAIFMMQEICAEQGIEVIHHVCGILEKTAYTFNCDYPGADLSAEEKVALQTINNVVKLRAARGTMSHYFVGIRNDKIVVYRQTPKTPPSSKRSRNE